MENLVGKIETILSGLKQGGFLTIVQPYSIMGDERIKIAIATSDKLINGVRGQYPDLISFSLDKDLNLQAQSFGGSGGGSLYRNINPENSDERYLAMKSVKVSFRKPQQTEKAVLGALERLTINYYETLLTFKRQGLLRYADLSDYDNLLV